MPLLDDELERWVGAGVMDTATAARIRVFEKLREKPAALRWQVLLALILGALLLAAGTGLFVAAHWDELSPGARFTLTMGILIVLHGAGIAVRSRFERLAIALHGVGTVAAGAAIALVGQIFNIQEHWPAGILLWALCALAGWAVLGDQVQQTATLLLIPAWIICEYAERTRIFDGAEPVVQMMTAFAAAYLVAFVNEKKKFVFGVLFAIGSVGVIVGTLLLVSGFDMRLSSHWPEPPPMPGGMLIVVWICTIVLPLLAAWRFNPPAIVPLLVFLGMIIVLPYLRSIDASRYRAFEPWWVCFPLVGLVAAFLACWGVQQRSRAIVNYGIACFALTVLVFYFSRVMDKLERSFSLISLGVLFLGGGWVLEKLRRRLVRQIEGAA
jgi:uncharacterized membrane protein